MSTAIIFKIGGLAGIYTRSIVNLTADKKIEDIDKIHKELLNYLATMESGLIHDNDFKPIDDETIKKEILFLSIVISNYCKTFSNTPLKASSQILLARTREKSVDIERLSHCYRSHGKKMANIIADRIHSRVLPTILALPRESVTASDIKENLMWYLADAEELRYTANVDPTELAIISKDLKEIYQNAFEQIKKRDRWIKDMELCHILIDLKQLISQMNLEPNHCVISTRSANLLSSINEGH